MAATLDGKQLPPKKNTVAGEAAIQVDQIGAGELLNLQVKGVVKFAMDATGTITVGGGSGGPPSGAAGGDMSGTYPNPTVKASTVAFAFNAPLTPSQITANQNDYNPASLSGANNLRLSTDASRNITGMAGGAAGRILLVENVGSFNIVLKDEDAGSTAANRFALTADLTLTPDTAIILKYDSTSSRWRAFGGVGSGGGVSLTSNTPAASAVGDTGAVGSGTAAAKDDHRHAREGFAAPAASAVGDAQATGTATTVPHSDHVHARESFGTPGASAFGDTAAAGSAVTPARSDHRHSREADPVTAHAAAADPHAGYVLESLLDAKGDLIAASADNTPAKVTVGTDGQVLTADAASAAGVHWATPTGGGAAQPILRFSQQWTSDIANGDAIAQDDWGDLGASPLTASFTLGNAGSLVEIIISGKARAGGTLSIDQGIATRIAVNAGGGTVPIFQLGGDVINVASSYVNPFAGAGPVWIPGSDLIVGTNSVKVQIWSDSASQVLYLRASTKADSEFLRIQVIEHPP